jgi:hypothetical protein
VLANSTPGGARKVLAQSAAFFSKDAAQVIEKKNIGKHALDEIMIYSVGE